MYRNNCVGIVAALRHLRVDGEAHGIRRRILAGYLPMVFCELGARERKRVYGVSKRNGKREKGAYRRTQAKIAPPPLKKLFFASYT